MHTVQFCAVPKSLIRHQVYLHKFFRKAREIVFVIHVLFSSCYRVQKWQIPLPLRKKKIYSHFASEWKFCSLIATGVPTRLKRFIGQSLCLSKLLWALVLDKFRRQSIIIRVALTVEKPCCVSSVALLPPFCWLKYLPYRRKWLHIHACYT